MAELAPHLPQRSGLAAGWTGTTPLPGGEFDDRRDRPARGATDAQLPVPRQGARGAAGARLRHARLGAARQGQVDGGSRESFGATLTEAEVRYLVEHEWARSAEDVVWRRSKLGLHMSASEIAGLDAWMRRRVGPVTAASATTL